MWIWVAFVLDLLILCLKVKTNLFPPNIFKNKDKES